MGTDGESGLSVTALHNQGIVSNIGEKSNNVVAENFSHYGLLLHSFQPHKFVYKDFTKIAIVA